MKIINSTFLFFLFGQVLFAQNSFVKTIDNVSSPNLGFEIQKNDQLSVINYNSLFNKEFFRITNFTSDGIFDSGLDIKIDTFKISTRDFKYDNKGKYGVVSFNYNFVSGMDNAFAGLFAYNFETEQGWCRRTSKIGFGPFGENAFLTNTNKIIAVRLSPDPILPTMILTEFDIEDGEIGWSHKYYSSDSVGFSIVSATDYPTGEISLTVLFPDNFGLMKLSPTGEVINNIIFDEALFDLWLSFDQSHGTDDANNVYVIGKIINQPDWNNNHPYEGFIAKFDTNLDLVWAKRLSAENFPHEGLKHKVFPNGEVVFAYNTDGDLPVIVGKLDTDGNLLWHRGYSFFNPEIQIGEDGSIYFLSTKKYHPDGTSEPGTILAKADPNGDIANCPQFDACLTLHDMDITYTSWDWVREPADTFPEIPFTITPFTTTTEDYCGTPAPPNPRFFLPDTICQNITLEPDSTYNFLAHAVQWTITGKNTNIEISDTSWNHQFTEPDTYQIEQETWLLGCSEFFTRTLVVLPDSLGNLLGEDRLICEDNPLSLSPTAARPLRTFEWSDGSQNPNITISNSGTYAVTASDGFCSASDEVELTFFKDKYPNEVFELPTDSMVCVDLLPFSLTPTSEFTDSFYLENSTTPQAVFELKAEGNYQIAAQIENCRVEKNFELKIIPCEVDIFIPNTFSPNDDGINDFAQPFGKEFDSLSLEIFDRWGGKVFESTAAPFAWDGNFNGKKANEGVYVFVFKYRNLRNGLEEMVSGDVLLMR